MKRRLTALLVVLAACHASGPHALSGANSPETAVDMFLAAGRAKDLQALGAVWGTTKGPARDGLSSAEMAAYEKSELTIVSLLCQDTAKVVQKMPGVDASQVLKMELKRGAKATTLNFTTVRGPSSRWYVSNFEIEKLQSLCR